MGYVEVAHLSVTLDDGRTLFEDVGFRVGEGAKVALIGANGTGKTTLLRLVAGDQAASGGTVTRAGGVGVMRQFVGSITDPVTVRDLLVSLAPPALRSAADGLDNAEAALATSSGEKAQMRYAEALAHWGDVGGYAAEVLWDTVTVATLGLPFDRARDRIVPSLSGGEQKRLALEALLRGPDDVLLLDEPDNYLDIAGKRWLEDRLRETAKTVLYVSHDREVLARTATRIVTLEGGSTWVHGGGFGSYAQAHADRLDRLEELHRRWDEQHQRLKDLVRRLQQQAAISDVMAGRYHAAQTRLARFESEGPPPRRPDQQRVTMSLAGGRTGVRALRCSELELTGLVRPFDLEVDYGERVAVLGANGTGKSHLLRLLAGEPIAHTGGHRLGARVRTGHFAQTHEHPELAGRTLVEILWRGDDGREGRDRGRALSALRRYELHREADQTFDRLSGGQQARFQILLLELSDATMLLLDEPTDNLDLVSAAALEDGLQSYQGTVLAVTHDRWFARGFDRYLSFARDGTVSEVDQPDWQHDETALLRRE